ncbi:tetratricopeptide repeat protein [Actinoplanes sp. TRM 88003]|uniref:Tetratricopeptide repeat protein n=1 Tax=Paractinoplanes aksuensis TaxID=2939490 RepID=A0ABT1DJS9_9ACTN|nr:BTAD domain-containing putative transcriptional regulator [Actinoplanes aksuensis]MCO8270733.1 tetratricopeptide repeat protein [Actinoplanes aksuensis]
MLDFTLLGAVEIWRDGQRVDAGHPRQRAVLASLLAEAGRPVPTDVVIDRVWGHTPPPSVRPTLHAHIARLRRIVQPDVALRFASGCYVLEADAGRVDVHRFGALVARAADAQSPAGTRLDLLRAAMGLWRGEPLAGLTGDWAEQTRASWQRQHADASMAWAEAELRAANPAAVLPLLTDLSERNPLHEALAVALMQALCAAGRPAEALAHFETIRTHLQSELGADPGPALQDMHRIVLRGEVPGTTERTARPAQLPAAPATFVGRGRELAALDEWRTDPAIAVVGPAGVGKTALVLRWCWAVRQQFPDGQLYVDMRGFGDGDPVDPADALDRMLRALGVPPEQIARDPDERSAQLRSELADRRVLVVLDNARSARQVRALLPGGSGSLAMVTSRSRLDGLVAEGVRRLPLVALTSGEATALVRRIAGHDAVGDDGLTGRLVALCEGLPLAVSVVAARLDAPHRLLTIVRELEDERNRLSVLDVQEDDVSVRRALGFSVRSLDDPARRLFGLLSAHPGQTPTLGACAALLGQDIDGTRMLLDSLAAVHLVQLPSPGRYRMHDLVRLAAREQAAASAEQHTARRRVLLWYRDTANTADRVLRPAERPNFASPAPVTFADAEEAMAWLDAEADNLTAAVLVGCRSDPAIGWQIAAALYGWLVRRRHLDKWVELYQVAAGAAAEVGDSVGEGLIRSRLAAPYSSLGRIEQASLSCRRAYELRRADGDLLGAATALLNLGAVQNNARQADEAIRWLGEAAQLSGKLDGAGHLRALIASNLGEAHGLRKQYDQAVRHYRTALRLAQEHCGPRDVGEIMRQLAETYRDSGRPAEADRYAGQAMERARTAGDPLLEVKSLVVLGQARKAQGRHADADQFVRKALALSEPLDSDRAAALRALLDSWAVATART